MSAAATLRGGHFTRFAEKYGKRVLTAFVADGAPEKVLLDRDDPAYEVDYDVSGMCLDGVGLGCG